MRLPRPVLPDKDIDARRKIHRHLAEAGEVFQFQALDFIFESIGHIPFLRRQM
jgi:hypothetical protein